MQANLFQLLAIAAAFSAVHSAPVETAEVTGTQVNGTQVNGTQVNGTQVNGTQVNETQTNDSYKLAGVEQICYKRDLPHISKRGKEGDLFKRACRNYSCWHDDQCKNVGCTDCVLYFDKCGNSWTACH